MEPRDLKRQKERLIRTVAGLKVQANEKAKAVHQAVAKAFERATSKELEAIGEASLLHGFLGKAGSAVRDGRESIGGMEGRPIIRRAVRKRAAQQPADIFMRFGVKADVADRVANAISLAVGLGLPLLIRGGLLAEELTISLGHGICNVLQIPIGVVENNQFGTESGLVSADPDAAILVSGANLSDMSPYAPEIIDFLVERSLGWRVDPMFGPMVLSLVKRASCTASTRRVC